ncbi:MAG: DNA repair protein RecO [Candidatus Magasanikbacteria bacterium]|nr:DNA repair protein RecO [Candidatus Magasanikbacteria bacterium]
MYAIVLERRDFRENDQLITFYTKDSGKVDVLARGVKKIVSKNSANLEPFCFVDAEILQGKEMRILGSVQSINSFSNLRQDFKKILLAQFTVKMLSELTQENLPDNKVFIFLYSWLNFLNELSCVVNYITLLNSFTLKMSALLGFLPQLNFCVHCPRRCYDGGNSWFFHFSGGGVLCENCKIKHFIQSKDLAFLGGIRNDMITLIISKFSEVGSIENTENPEKVYKFIIRYLESFNEKEVSRVNLSFFV